MLSLLSLSAKAGAQRIERKIVVENGQFRFISIDPETQLAHLHTGAMRQKSEEADDWIIPTGRNNEDPVNPLAFSLRGDELISVNWMLNALNSRYDAIRQTDLRYWRKPRPDWHSEEWAEASFAQTMVAPNEPWQQMLAENNVLSDCYFDLIAAHKHLVMAVCNQGKMRIWQWDGKIWNASEALSYPDKCAFSLVARGSKVGIWSSAGTFYLWDISGRQLKTIKRGLPKNLLLVEDHDRDKYFLLNPQLLEAGATQSFEAILNESGIELTF